MKDMHRRPPFVSVCIPVRNGQGQLRHTLLNLLTHSSYPRDRCEILLGDHGSTDATPMIIADFHERFPQIRSIRVPFTRPNRAHVRNRIICESRGDLLVFIDHDVLVSDEFLWKHVEAHEKFPSAIVAGAIFGVTLYQGIERFARDLKLDHVSASYPLLSRSPEFADPRMRPGLLPEGSEAVDILMTPAPFCFFWGGNLSAHRSDIDACGLFDEVYEGWGLEDNDFAQQFRVGGRGMAFSPGAWALHLPGVADHWNRLGQWRKNFDTFFRKFATREIESCSLYGPEFLSVGMRRLEGALEMLKGIDVSATVEKAGQQIGPSKGRRMGHFVGNSSVASALQLTDALSPFCSPTETHRYDGRTHWWPLFGFKTPFGDKEIDEVVLLVDVLMWLDQYILTLVLSETARVARRAILCCRSNTAAQADSFPVQVLRKVLGTLNFANVSWIEV